MAGVGLIPDRAKVTRASFELAKLKKFGTLFEIVLKSPEAALEFRHGKNVDIRDILDTPKIFEDAQKAVIHGTGKLKELLKNKIPDARLAVMTESELTDEAAKFILKEGDIALTQEMRKKFFEAKKKKIVDYIHANAADPKSGLPLPVQRIELAMEQAKVQIDPYQPAEAQIDNVIKQLRPVVPISFEKAKVRVQIPANYSGTAYSTIKNKFDLKNESWGDDGAVSFELELPAGIKAEFFSLVNKLTQGEATIEEKK